MAPLVGGESGWWGEDGSGLHSGVQHNWDLSCAPPTSPCGPGHVTPAPALCSYSCALSNVKKVSLELGGKSPLIIFADCDLNKAVQMVR